MQCDIEHDNNYKIISYKEIMPNVENIKSKIKELRNIIDRFNNDIDEMIRIVNIINNKNIEKKKYNG